MPLHLMPVDVSNELAGAESVLIVTCPVCAPVSLAVERDGPLVELFKHGVKTAAYQELIGEMRESLERRGVRTGVFTAYRPTPTMCMWTEGQQRRLRKRARRYDAVVVMGCESAVQTAIAALAETDCDVVLGMRTVGLTNATMKFHFPMKVTFTNKSLVEIPEQAAAARHESSR